MWFTSSGSCRANNVRLRWKVPDSEETIKLITQRYIQFNLKGTFRQMKNDLK